MQQTCEICRSKLNATRFSKGGVTLWACKKCQLGVVLPKPSHDEVKKYYQDAYSSGNYLKVVEIGKQVKSHKFERLLNLIRKELKINGFAGKSILDVGCGDGIFLNLAKGKGCVDLTGVEIAENAANKAAAMIGENNVFIGTIEEYAQMARRKHSFITLFDLIEHVEDVVQLMNTVDNLLEKDGQIVLTTPNWRSFYAFVLGARWPYFIPTEHLSFFTPRTIEYMAKKYNYHVMVLKKTAKPISFRYFIELLNYLSPSLAKTPSLLSMFVPARLMDYSFPFYLGEFLAILRK